MTSVIRSIFKKVIVTVIIFILIIGATFSYFVINYPLSYQNLIKRYSEEFGIDPYLVASIINVESKYDKKAISNKEARGLMQIAPITGEWAAESLNINEFDTGMLFEPEINIMIGTWYLNVLHEEFDDNLQLVLAAYNAGSGNVVKWLADKQYSEDQISLKQIPFQETEEYITKVNKNIRIYKILYEGEFETQSKYDENYLVLLINTFRKLIKNLTIYK